MRKKRMSDWMKAWDKANGWDGANDDRTSSTGSTSVSKFDPDKLNTKSGTSSFSSGGKSSGGNYKNCHETHKPLEVVPGVFITGGSCSWPLPGKDIYVGFDSDMKLTGKHLPFYEGEGQELYFPMEDRQPPDDPVMFAKLVEHVANALVSGKTVHCGCIGGHGRTGTFLAALVKFMRNETDAIKFVRDNYCEKAVESQSQVDFLVKHWGITAQKPRDHGGGFKGSSSSQKNFDFKSSTPGVKSTGQPVEGVGCIW